MEKDGLHFNYYLKNNTEKITNHNITNTTNTPEDLASLSLDFFFLKINIFLYINGSGAMGSNSSSPLSKRRNM